ncbi:NB-ARC domains-containing protein [Artemisia annua]|uniref:NB-ARC domains-containing protein n=1 Tax=Artemisia annua TaxID=35608 RepID=A0A2U1KF20_ARTAN|nr:NB-ARC domains-containing protein [Artemisia annua]
MMYTGLELFMENLKNLIYWDDNPLISNNPLILSERPQIELLYKELELMIQYLFDEKEEDLHELEKVKNLKKEFKDVAQEAHNTVGRFVYFMNASRYDFTKCSLNLKNVMRSINSIKREYITIVDKQKMDSAPSIDYLKIQYTPALRTKKPLGEEMVVGLDQDVKLIRDQLVQDQKQLDVVSIVGMGGLGKTTLANKVFNDPYVMYHFQVRAWVTVSHTYEKSDLLIQILASIGSELDSVETSYYQLRDKLHKSLMNKRYFIVIDDIWSNEAWDDLKVFFPNYDTKSRILVTSRLKEVAVHAKSNGFVHHMDLLTDEESWELLCKKVFNDNACPEWLIKPGMEIAKKCHGLPLAVVVIGGVLTKEAEIKESWERIAQSVSAYIVNDPNGYLDMLTLCYDHLPPHLKDCFLYLGGFPEKHKFRVQSLIWLWMAEGFIQESGNRSLQEIGEDYLMELVDRNLVVADRKFNGAIKACSVHDLLRELCLEKATKEHFYLKINTPALGFGRIFTNVDIFIKKSCYRPSPRVRSILSFHSGKSMLNTTFGDFYFYPILMVLDLQKCRLENFPQSIELLVHLRYLAFWYTGQFPSSICNLWSLQTLIVRSFVTLMLPNTISNLVNLRHLRSDKNICFRSIEKPMNLLTISKVVVNDGAENLVKYIPRIKKLTSWTDAAKDHDFRSLTSLETLMSITGSSLGVYGQREYASGEFQNINMRLPTSLKKLSLAGCCLPWSDMSILQSLPNLEVLKILDIAFVGPLWETGERQFQRLKFLKLQGLDIQHWEASELNFPCLKRLVVDRCEYLEEIPLELGDIPTLELIEVDKSSVESIIEQQSYFGNFDLKINVRKGFHSRRSHWKLQGLQGSYY